MRTLTTTAGELEREARSRRANAVEALGFACWILGVLWPVCFACGVLGGHPDIRVAGEWALKGALLWTVVSVALVHRDAPASLGLGHPRQWWASVQKTHGPKRWLLAAGPVALFALLMALSFAYWPDTARIFRLPVEARAWLQEPGGHVKVALAATGISAAVALFVVRWDNFGSALRPVLCLAGALLLYAATAAFLNHGAAAWGRFVPARYPLEVIAYAFWGMTQQFFFTSYFSTRLRKAFPPSDALPIRGNVHRSVWIGGAIAACAIGPSVGFAAWGAGDTTLARLLGCMAFAFPVGAIWTHFYLRDQRRMLVATLSGGFFGLIHLTSYGLVLVTFLLGTIFAYLFMEDRFRNLAVIGFAHGLLGTTFGKLFKTDAAGALAVTYHVGPWHIAKPTLGMLWIPMFCFLGFAALLIWAVRSRRFAVNESPTTRALPLPATMPTS